MNADAIAETIAAEFDELVRERMPEVAAALERLGERPCVAVGLVERIRREL